MVDFRNHTGQTLWLSSYHRDSDSIWTIFPPSTISAHGVGAFGTESNALFTGTAGGATYHITDVGDVKLDWSNPYIGSNSYATSTPPGYTVERSDGSGNNATIIVTLHPTVSASCEPAGATITIKELSALGFTFSYGNGSTTTASFTTTMAANGVWGPQHRVGGTTVGPGLGSTQYPTISVGDPGPGTYPIVLRTTSSLTGSEVLAACEFTLVLATRAPHNLQLPSIVGTATTGAPMTCVSGKWDRTVTSTTYRWLDETNATRGTNAVYTPTTADEGRTLTCEVTATNAGGSTTARSPSTSPVTPAPPSAATETAINVSATTAELSATVNPHGAATTFRFDYGTSTTYVSHTSSHAAGSDFSDHSVTATIYGLSPNTTYHFRVAATNAGGTTYGADEMVKTSVTKPSVTVTSPSTAARYLKNEIVPAAYACTADAGAMLVSCSGPVANGRPIDTRTIGLHWFTVTAIDNFGSRTSQSVAYRVVPRPGGNPSTSPVLSRVRQSARRWRLGDWLPQAAGTGTRAPFGTTFSFRLNVTAQVSLSFSQKASGRILRGKCVPDSRRHRRSSACTRTIPSGTFALQARKGDSRVRFAGRISRTKKLHPGTYTVKIVATDTSGNRSKAFVLTFTIVK